MEDLIDKRSTGDGFLPTEIYRSVGRLEGKIDYLVSHLVEHFEDDKEAFSEFKQRLTSLEKKVWMFSGGSAILALLLGWTVDLIQHTH